MKLFERPSKAQIGTVLALAVGTTGLAGCGEYRSAPEGGLHLKNGTLYVPGESAGKFSTLHCDGTVLVEHLEQEWERDDVLRIVNDPACYDRVLTAADFASEVPQQ